MQSGGAGVNRRCSGYCAHVEKGTRQRQHRGAAERLMSERPIAA
jgi:hypothetical protein